MASMTQVRVVAGVLYAIMIHGVVMVVAPSGFTDMVNMNIQVSFCANKCWKIFMTPSFSHLNIFLLVWSRRIMHIFGLYVLQSGDIEMKKNPLSTGENEN